ncbi:MAG TPA: hypothetical protein VHU91_04430 [Mycobacteriales bacterium]|nr:hypothetical protein [Mycobacteriales bacterium]
MPHRSATALRRAVIALAAFALLAGGLAACGSDSKDSTAPPAGGALAMVNTAQQRVLTKKSARVDGEITPATGAQAMHADGIISWEKQATGTISISTGQGKGATTALITDDATYVSMGGDFQLPSFPSLPGMPMLPSMGNAKWMKLSLTDLGNRNATGKVIRNELRYNNPSRSIAFLRQAGDITQVGMEKKNGVDTRHFHGRVEISKLVADHRVGLTDSEIRDFRSEQEALGVKYQDMDVWLNSDDLPVRVEITSHADGGDLKFIGNYSDFGVKVEVKAPPESEVFDIGKLQNSMSRFGSPN